MHRTVAEWECLEYNTEGSTMRWAVESRVTAWERSPKKLQCRTWEIVNIKVIILHVTKTLNLGSCGSLFESDAF